jgi:pheromone shutdown-related protein TraB
MLKPEHPATEPLVELTLGQTQVTLLGTAHVSRASIDQVAARLRDPGCYSAVAVELCPSRYQALTDPNALARLDLFAVLREKRAHMVAAHLALSAYQQRLAAQLGVEPGAEQREAIEQAQRLGLPVWLIDRDIGITLRRAARNLSWWQRLNLFAGLVAGLLSREQVTEQDIETLKQGDVLETAFSEFAHNRQSLFEPLITERDRYMAARLRAEIAALNVPADTEIKVLVVIGAGHCKGLARELKTQSGPPQQLLADLQAVPPAGGFWQGLPWLIVAIILGLFVYGFTQGPDIGWEVLGDWVLINGGLCALGAALAGAHPLTVLGAFCAAPLTSLNPTIGAGMVVGAIELLLRRPRVADFHDLRDHIARWSGWWHNRVARVLLVFVLSTLGSALGTYIAGFHLVARLFG